MRSIKVRDPDDPLLQQRLAAWEEKAKIATARVCAAPAAKRKAVMEENEKIYQGVKEYLFWLFQKRCAYCEKPLDEYGRVEHYRPKEIYYWLMFDRKNLLLSCELCNGKKSNVFPLAGRRAAAPTSRIREDPLLLCPYDEGTKRAPERHLTFVADPQQPNYGWPLPIRNSTYGVSSIETYNLQRESLREERKKAMDLFRRKFGDRVNAGGGLDSVIQEVKDGCAYSAACQASLALAQEQIERAFSLRRKTVRRRTDRRA